MKSYQLFHKKEAKHDEDVRFKGYKSRRKYYEVIMKLSERAINVQASPIRKLMPFANETKKKGIHIYHLNTVTIPTIM